MKNLTIRLVNKSDFSICQQIVKNQQLIWDMPAVDAMPFWKLMALGSTGGFLVGAFDDEEIIGHAVFTPAVDRTRQESFFYLDMIGVLPHYQNCGLAEKMLRFASDCAIDQKVESIQWTFDPLETANANLYIRKLGACAEQFYPDYYGPPFKDDAALKTDRFWARWDFQSVPRETLPEHIITLNAPTIPSETSRMAIELPNDLRTLAKTQSEVAVAWRRHTSAVFSSLFKNGFKITGFVRLNEKNYYIATHS